LSLRLPMGVRALFISPYRLNELLASRRLGMTFSARCRAQHASPGALSLLGAGVLVGLQGACGLPQAQRERTRQRRLGRLTKQ
jgi:hypothetical protein